jgi:long-subunit fatty acid transport protein
MKKFIYLIAFYYSSINLYSQIREKNVIELTPKIGISTFKYYASGNPSGSLNSKNFGITGDYYLNEIWSLRTGLLYQKMGGKTFSDNFEVDYINLPINANWHFGSTKKWNLNFGITAGFRANNSEKQNVLGAQIKNTQTGFNLGIGYKIELTKNIGILLDYQYFSGLTNIDKDEIYVLTNKGANLNIGAVIKL